MQSAEFDFIIYEVLIVLRLRLSGSGVWSAFKFSLFYVDNDVTYIYALILVAGLTSPPYDSVPCCECVLGVSTKNAYSISLESCCTEYIFRLLDL